MQFTIVSAVPVISLGAFLATNVERSGESAITTIPQKTRKDKKTKLLSIEMISGEIRQHTNEKKRDKKTVCLVPNF